MDNSKLERAALEVIMRHPEKIRISRKHQPGQKYVKVRSPRTYARVYFNSEESGPQITDIYFKESFAAIKSFFRRS